MFCSMLAEIDIGDFAMHCTCGCFKPSISWYWFLNENYGCGWRTMATVALFFHATFCCSVTIIRARDERSDALFKRKKQCFGWTKFVWCLHLLSMTINIVSSLTDAWVWITPSFWNGNDSWWSWILQTQPSRIFHPQKTHNRHDHPTDLIHELNTLEICASSFPFRSVRTQLIPPRQHRSGICGSPGRMRVHADSNFFIIEIPFSESFRLESEIDMWGPLDVPTVFSWLLNTASL